MQERIEEKPRAQVICAGSYEVATARVVKVNIPFSHTLLKVRSELDLALTTADLVVTVRDNAAAAMTGGTLTITQAASAIGDRDSATITAGGSQEADKDVQLDMNGGPDAGQATFWLELERTD